MQAGMSALIVATVQDQEEEHQRRSDLGSRRNVNLEALLCDKIFDGTEAAHVAVLAACTRACEPPIRRLKADVGACALHFVGEGAQGKMEVTSTQEETEEENTEVATSCAQLCASSGWFPKREN